MRASRTPIALFGLAVAGLLAAAPNFVYVRDNFNNNSVNATLWKMRQFGQLTLQETNGRLEFAAPAGPGDSYAGLEVKPWGIDWRRGFEVAIDYRFKVNNVVGSREALVGVGLVLGGTYPQTMTGYEASIARDDTGLYLWIARYNHGAFMEGNSVPITQTEGVLFVEYFRDDDELTVDTGPGGGFVSMTGAWDHYGATKGNTPMVIGIGCSTYGGNKAITATRAQIDDFYFWGVKKSR